MSLVLLEHPDSPNCRKVRLLLAALDVRYESRCIELLRGETHTQAFLDINRPRSPISRSELGSRSPTRWTCWLTCLPLVPGWIACGGSTSGASLAATNRSHSRRSASRPRKKLASNPLKQRTTHDPD